MNTLLEEQKVILTNESKEKETFGKVRIQHWNNADRLKRAFKLSGIFFGLAIISIFIPGIHFVLVPGFLLACPIVFNKVYHQTQMVLDGSGTCPECGKDFKIAMSYKALPFHDLCNECFHTVQVLKKID